MTNNPSSQADEVPPSSRHTWAEVCHRFERTWQQGPPPRIEDFLGETAGEERTELLRRLVRLDVRCRLLRGLDPRSEEYHVRFPQLDPTWLDEALRTLSGIGSSAATRLYSPRTPVPPAGLCCPHCFHSLPVSAGNKVLSCPECGGSVKIEGGESLSTVDAIRQLGRFQLLDHLGQGSFGSVWKARDTELGRLVALKIPFANLLSSSHFAERFRREARAAAQLRHPGIVRLYEVVTLGGLPVLVSDLIDGVPLKDLLEVRRLTFNEAATLTADVAEALDYAHGAGLVHRDVKPGNLLIESSSVAAMPGKRAPLGKPILVDFGLALRDEAEAVMTVEGQILGTPAYMSPEQASGQGHRVDRRSDVYSLGVVLYELLTGERPFRGTRAMLLHQVLHEEPRPPRRLNDHIPRDLETICLKAMAKEPAQRYATARAFADDLRRFLRGEPIQARPVGRVERAWRGCRRNPTVTMLAAAVALSLLAGTVVATYFAFRAHAGERQALEQAEQVRREKLVSDRQRYAAQINQAHREWMAGQLTLVHSLLDDQEAQDATGDFRGFEWHYLRRLCQLEWASWCEGRQPVRALAFSPGGRWLACVGDDLPIRIWDMAEGKEAFRLPGHTQPVYAVAFSPDGTQLASAACAGPSPDPPPGEVKVWDLAMRREAFSLTGHRGGVHAVAFSPDGKRLVTAGGRRGEGRPLPGEVTVWDLAARQPGFTLSGHDRPVLGVACSRDGQRLATAGEDNQVLVWDAAQAGKPVLRLAGHYAPVFSVAFSPDGKLLASAGWDQTVRVWDAATGKPHIPLVGHTGAVQSVAFRRDSKGLASAGWDRAVRLWEVDTGRETQVLRGHTQCVRCVAFSPDGWRLASAGDDGSVKVWGAAGACEPCVLTGHSSGLQGVAFSPDGQRLASAGRDHAVMVWDTALGLATHTLGGHGGQVCAVAFSPLDGQRLASAGDDRTVRIWDLTGRQKPLILGGHADAVTGVAFHPDGGRLASACRDGKVKVWDTQTGAELQTLAGSQGAILAVAFSADRRSLAAAGADGSIKIWDLDTGALRRPPLAEHRSAVTAIAFSPDGGRLASGGADHQVLLWDLTAGNVVQSLRGHTGTVRGVAFSPDGRRLASAGDDQTVKVWDTRIGAALLSLEGHTQAVTGVAFSPDGWQVASASEDQTARVWDAQPLTTEVAQRRQALRLLELRFRTPRPVGEVIAQIEADQTIPAAVRSAAQRLAPVVGQCLAHGDANRRLKP
jgi:WD40 repeat protein/tRNA A-37 threonylcarbamoyl transferase component Bud32